MRNSWSKRKNCFHRNLGARYTSALSGELAVEEFHQIRNKQHTEIVLISLDLAPTGIVRLVNWGHTWHHLEN
jgi:hypothetical protein